MFGFQVRHFKRLRRRINESKLPRTKLQQSDYADLTGRYEAVLPELRKVVEVGPGKGGNKEISNKNWKRDKVEEGKDIKERERNIERERGRRGSEKKRVVKRNRDSPIQPEGMNMGCMGPPLSLQGCIDFYGIFSSTYRTPMVDIFPHRVTMCPPIYTLFRLCLWWCLMAVPGHGV